MGTYYVAGIPYSSNELYHHGILGQKWGIRRWQNKDGSLTRAGAARYGVGTSDVLRSLKKGSVVYRSSVNANENESGHAYVSASEVDRDHYRGGLGATWLKNTSGGDSNTKLYESKYVLKRDPKVADREVVRDVYNELAKKDKRILKEAAKDRVKKDSETEEGYYKRSDMELEVALAKRDAEQIISKIGKQKYEEVLKKKENELKNYEKNEVNRYLKEFGDMDIDKLFDNYGATSFGGSDYTRNKVISELKKKGYDGMVDQASIGNSSGRKEGVAPLIVFDRADLMKKVNTREVSAKEQEKYGKRYDKWQRKG